jgi:uracil-DNA glycosylase family 4
MQGGDETQVRAWVEYFRDLGVYDFYRRGEFVAPAPGEKQVVASIQAEAVASVGGPARSSPAVADADSDADYPDDAVPVEHLATTSPAAHPVSPQLMKLVSFNALAPMPAAKIPVAERAAALHAIQEEIGDCTRCPLAYAGRRKIVFGDGSPAARLMFVGEGPGADEDAQGVPFVGKAGQLLNNMIAAMGLKREEVYIANIVKCRPPGNRVPEPVEANTCSQFLLRQIDVVQPEVIVALGATAAMYLLGVKQSLSSLRGHWHTCRGAKLVVTYHPAFLLRDPRQKVEAWKDLQMVMGELGLKAPAKK